MDATLERLRDGAVVAAPTESFVGLLACVDSATAIDALLRLKPRDAGKGIGLLLPTRAAWSELVVEIPPKARALADALWPGPLSIALPAAAGVDARLTRGGSIAVRLPGACAAGQLASALGRPVTATSANPPGQPPAHSIDEVSKLFSDAVHSGRLVLHHANAGTATQPSTMVVVRGDEVTIARPGAISEADIRAITG